MLIFHVLVIFVFLNADAHGIVKHITVLFRHGDRTPVQCYPNDPYNNEDLWPVPFGQLTNTGKSQHFELGKYIRKLYPETISKNYSYKEVHVQCTNVDRTLMSAQVHLAGLFPPFGDQVWNKNLMWQPIPVHTIPEHLDEVLAMKKYCASYNAEMEIYHKTSTYLDELKKYENLMNYLSLHTGMEVKNFNDIADIYSCLKIEELYNFTLPAWTQSVYPEEFKKPAGFSFSTSAATRRMARLIAGPLLQRIVTNMTSVANGSSKQKLSIYSGHDFTIGTLLTALRVFDGQCPEYTATIIFELVFDDQMIFKNYDEPTPLDGYFVRLLYRNTVQIEEPKVIDIPGCGRPCSLKRFTKLYSYLLTVDWETECKEVYFPSAIVFDLALRIVLIAIIFALFCFYRQWILRCLKKIKRSWSASVQSEKAQELREGSDAEFDFNLSQYKN